MREVIAGVQGVTFDVQIYEENTIHQLWESNFPSYAQCAVTMLARHFPKGVELQDWVYPLYQRILVVPEIVLPSEPGFISRMIEGGIREWREWRASPEM